MNTETEIKLRASREALAALRDHPLLKKRNKGGWQRHDLLNQYFDTPERDLAGARVALRLRRDGEQIIQTLKTRGQSVAGLSERNEWDWYLDDAQLDTSRLTDDCWPAALAELDRSRLQPIFTTDFVREKADIAWGRGKARVIIEAALDLGRVVAGEGQEEICELELELRQGEPAALLELAAELAADLPLMPCDISKAERGYRLFDPGSYATERPLPALDPERPVDEGFPALLWHLLGNSQRLAEQYRFNGHWSLLNAWLVQLMDLRTLLGSLGQVAPRASTRALREPLDALLQDWQPVIRQGEHDEDLRHAAPARFAEELQRTRWGAFSLALSHWLLTGGWKAGRNARGDRLGGVAMGRWLQRQLVDEAQALPLARYAQQAGSLDEQLPRLQRLVAWLKLARGVLEPEVPETDRLYGELVKLVDLLRQPRDADSSQACSEQAMRVQGLRAWKALAH